VEPEDAITIAARQKLKLELLRYASKNTYPEDIENPEELERQKKSIICCVENHPKEFEAFCRGLIMIRYDFSESAITETVKAILRERDEL
jgi:hypothetical protein